VFEVKKEIPMSATRREFLGAASATVLGAIAGERLAIVAEMGKPDKNMEHSSSETAINEKSSRSNVRGIFAFDPGIDAEMFAVSCREWGIRQVILPPSFFHDDKIVRALEKNNLGLWLNLPVFYNPEYLGQHPEHYAITNKSRKAVHDWCHFVCPSRKEYQDKFVRDMCATLSKLRPDIVSLDFIRHFVFWEAVDLRGNPDAIEDGCYCPVCLGEFERFCGEKVNRNQPAAHIHSNLKRAWGDWKCNQIAETAEMLFDEIRTLAKDALISIKTLPWREADLNGAIRSSAGQDVPRLTSKVDMTAPMAFTQVLGMDLAWKRELLKYVRQVSRKPVLSYVQTDRLIRPEEITATQFESELKESLSPEWAGIVVFEYQQLVANPAKAVILRKYLRG
jgi:hypothetical protein